MLGIDLVLWGECIVGGKNRRREAAWQGLQRSRGKMMMAMEKEVRGD